MTLPFRLRENFLGLVHIDMGVEGEMATGGLASPLLWVELVAMVARDEGMLEVLL